MEFKNIIFDLGGVIIDLDRQRAVDALKNLGVADAGALLGEYEQKGVFYQLETGAITSADLYDRLLPLCKPGTNCVDIRNAFEEFLVAIPPVRFDILEKLRKKGYRLYVLSNTNPVMFNDWISKAFKQRGKTMNDYFDGIVTSFQEGVCKPDPVIFERILSRYGLNPAETLFLDDSPANVKAASKVGIQTRLVNSPDLENILVPELF